MSRKVAVVTVGRSDWGIYRPVVRALSRDPRVTLRILAGGAHLDARAGRATIDEIERDAFAPVVRVPVTQGGDGSLDVAVALGENVAAFARAYDVAFDGARAELVVVLGDRFEMFAAAAAAVPLLIPLAHIHGGERTAGAIDDVFRHSITKMSHLHFVSTADFARRVRQLGEEPWRVTVSGAPGLDDIAALEAVSAPDLKARFDVDVEAPFALCTFHPTTLEPAAAIDQVADLIDALEAFSRDRSTAVFFSGTNADTGGETLRKAISAACARNPTWRHVENFGARAWFTLMKQAAVVVGNSSSGIIEAPSFAVPVVNIGTRQDGRPRAPNVIDVDTHTSGQGAQRIAEALQRATSTAFRTGLQDLKNPYGDGHASARIVEVIATTALDDRLLRKGFVDWSAP